MRLDYNRPAEAWEETLPLGNGSLGALVWGGPEREQWGLNEESLWSGVPRDRNNPGALAHLPEARRLIFEGRHVEAEDLIRRTMLGEYGESYLPLGNLRLESPPLGQVEDYRRTLDLDTAVATVSFRAGARRVVRRAFASHPHRALVLAIEVDGPALDLTLGFDSLLITQAHAEGTTLKITGRCPEHVDPSYLGDTPQPVIQGTQGVAFEARVRVVTCDGTVEARGDRLVLKGTTRTLVAVSAVQDEALGGVTTWDELLAAHLADYQGLYRRVTLDLGPQKDAPTDQRLAALARGEDDPGLFALHFQYGRYLLIASSRGRYPANLQGIWNWHLRAPWSSNFTTNINVQMNYWPALEANLAECLDPYFAFVDRLVENGRVTARVHYGCRGFTVHHNSDAWAITNPMGRAQGAPEGEGDVVQWSFWPLGGAWLVAELWRAWEYSGDRRILARVHPIVGEAALFLNDWLVEHDGLWHTCPSTSPENRFYAPGGGTASAAQSSAMDLALIREVFGHYLEGCRLLGAEDELAADIRAKLERLAPFQVGSRGQLLEWDREYAEVEPGHRHVSHLYGLFPGELFEKDEVLKVACRRSLEDRLAQGGGHTGWSCAWIINLFAVLGDGEQAYHYLHTLLTRSTYPNLWDAHPPFQIDGNFGGAAGLVHMLVQDRGGEVKLLPALPQAWSKGRVTGLRLKGGRTLDLEWRDGQVVSQRITAAE